ncbi:hypothetical protein J1614_011699 [Plenodomus biglobosus]|nr:hypothetical protein J1614_011699 [Plenodomus biglobosus]
MTHDTQAASHDHPQLGADAAVAYDLTILPTLDADGQLGYFDLAASRTLRAFDIRVCIWDGRTSSYRSSLYSNSTGASQVLRLAKRWLTNCLKDHQKCTGVVTSPHHRPTRLVRLRSTSGRVQSISLFCYVPGQDQPVEYLTLSHCWGQANIIQLKSTNLTAFQTDIPMDQLPQTFADAVHITHFLGYEYLWIDSLCIVQDSFEDWTTESKSMGKIYQHGICTLAAVGADDSRGGCFYKRLFLKEYCAYKQYVPFDLFAHRQQGRGHDSGCPAPLHSRAWVMQEQCLSVRTINFGRHQISWNCVSSTASERESSMCAFASHSTLPYEFYESLAQPAGAAIGSESPKSLEFWWKIVQQYSRRRLTVGTDKWPAFQGLASEVAQAWNRSLFYGLWEHDLSYELLWSINVKPLHLKLEAGAPSWSWLSMRSAVERWNLRFQGPTIVHAHVKASSSRTPLDSSSAHFSEPRAPELQITGALASVVTYAFEWVNTPGRFRFCLVKRRPHLRRITRRKAAEQIVQQSATVSTWIPDITFDPSWNAFALHLATYMRDDGSGVLAGLVITPTATSMTTFTRLGFFTYHSEDVMGLRANTFGQDMDITLL